MPEPDLPDVPDWVWEERALWVDVSPMRPDDWPHQRSAVWLRAEAIQRAFQKGAEDERDEQRQRDIEQREKDQNRAKFAAKERGMMERLLAG